MTLLVGARITAPQFDNMPQELRALPQWCCWTTQLCVDKDGVEYYSKVPANIKTKRRLAWRNPKNLYTFDEVKAAYEQGGFNGIGFVLYEDTPFVCADFDDIKNIENVPADLHNLTIHSYTEKSPSGNGLHLWIKGQKPSWVGTKKNGVELFGGQARFVTVTGDLYNSMPIVEHPKLIDMIVEKFFGKPPKNTKQKKSPNLQNEGKSFGKLSDDEIINRMENSNPKAFRVYQGDFSEYGNDHSSAIAGLLPTLAYWTNNDATQMDSIVRSMHNFNAEKWDRPQNSSTWGAIEIQSTIERQTNTYAPSISKNKVNNQPSIAFDGSPASIAHALKTSGLLEINDKGKVLPNAFNIEKIMDTHFKNTVGYDVFKKREVIIRDLPWRNRQQPNKRYENWLDSDDNELRHFIGVHYGIANKQLIMDAYVSLNRKNSFHPIKQYLEKIQWDGELRAETFFIDWLGADDNNYTRQATRKWLIAAVRRIYEPGTKYDEMPVLIGDQGVGKSSTVKKLGGEWFNDSLRSFDSKEAGEQLQSAWIFEIPELAAMNKKEVDEVKAFISKQEDSFRVAYGRIVQDFPRHCVFIGTTNHHEFLRDQTGNRRFLPIQVSPTKRKYDPFNDFTPEVAQQIWAEAFHYHQQGESLVMNEEALKMAAILQDEHTEMDSRFGLVQDFVERLLPPDWDSKKRWERVNWLHNGEPGTIKREKVCALEVWAECFDNEATTIKTSEARNIGAMLKKMGWVQDKRSTHKIYGKQTMYIRADH